VRGVGVGEEVPGADWRRGWEDIVGGEVGVESVNVLVKNVSFVPPVGLGGGGVEKSLARGALGAVTQMD